MSPLDVLGDKKWMTGHLASTPTCFDWTALGIKIMPRGDYDHLTVLEMHVHWSFFYIAFILFFSSEYAPRSVVLQKGPEGYGFVLRGAKCTYI